MAKTDMRTLTVKLSAEQRKALLRVVGKKFEMKREEVVRIAMEAHEEAIKGLMPIPSHLRDGGLGFQHWNSMARSDQMLDFFLKRAATREAAKEVAALNKEQEALLKRLQEAWKAVADAIDVSESKTREKIAKIREEKAASLNRLREQEFQIETDIVMNGHAEAIMQFVAALPAGSGKKLLTEGE